VLAKKENTAPEKLPLERKKESEVLLEGGFIKNRARRADTAGKLKKCSTGEKGTQGADD